MPNLPLCNVLSKESWAKVRQLVHSNHTNDFWNFPTCSAYSEIWMFLFTMIGANHFLSLSYTILHVKR